MASPLPGESWTNIFGNTQSEGPNAEQNLISQLMASVAPQLAAGNEQIGLTQQQIGLQNTNLGQTQAYNNQLAGQQQAGLDISGQQIGLQQLANTQQQAQSAAQQGFEQQAYGLNQFGGTVIGPNGKPINVTGQPQEQAAEAALAYQNSLMQTQGNQAISGTQNTVGGKAAINTLNTQYGFQQQDIARQSALSQIGQAGEVSGYQYSQQQLQNAQKNLALNAQANGLSQQQLLTMLGQQNQQAGASAQQNIIGLYSQLGQQELGQVSTAGSALSQLGFATNLNTLAGMK